MGPAAFTLLEFLFKVGEQDAAGLAKFGALQTLRINAVSPPWVAETLELMGQDRSAGMPAVKVAAAYLESVEGRQNGKILDARAFA